MVREMVGMRHEVEEGLMNVLKDDVYG